MFQDEDIEIETDVSKTLLLQLNMRLKAAAAPCWLVRASVWQHCLVPVQSPPALMAPETSWHSGSG